MRKLYRNKQDGQIFGVCAGLGDHFDVDPVIFRIGFVSALIFAGIGILPYCIMALIIPNDPRFN